MISFDLLKCHSEIIDTHATADVALNSTPHLSVVLQRDASAPEPTGMAVASQFGLDMCIERNRGRHGRRQRPSSQHCVGRLRLEAR
jgi:hypothetical protein